MIQMDCERIVKHVVGWLRDYLGTSGAEGYAIGISGGIDSALVSTLAAMTGARCLAAALPIRQATAQMRRAVEHQQWLKARFPDVETACIDLTEAFDTFECSMPVVGNPVLAALAGANARSRLRMTALYYLAGSNGLLVAGTGNRVEDFGIGFFTKYGDGGVDVSPIADLTKTEVFRLSRWLGIVPSILEAPPTDGLFGDDRTDEQQIGASYPELEKAMQYDAEGVHPENLSGREREVLELYIRRNRANRHKMQLPPSCPVPDEFRR